MNCQSGANVVPSGTASVMKVASRSAVLAVGAVTVLFTLRVRKLTGALTGEDVVGCLHEMELTFACGIDAYDGGEVSGDVLWKPGWYELNCCAKDRPERMGRSSP